MSSSLPPPSAASSPRPAADITVPVAFSRSPHPERGGDQPQAERRLDLLHDLAQGWCDVDEED